MITTIASITAITKPTITLFHIINLDSGEREGGTYEGIGISPRLGLKAMRAPEMMTRKIWTVMLSPLEDRSS